MRNWRKSRKTSVRLVWAPAEYNAIVLKLQQLASNKLHIDKLFVCLIVTIQKHVLTNGGQTPCILKHDIRYNWVIAFMIRPLYPCEMNFKSLDCLKEAAKREIVNHAGNRPLSFIPWTLCWLGIRNRDYTYKAQIPWNPKSHTAVIRVSTIYVDLLPDSTALLSNLCEVTAEYGLWRRK